MAAHGCITEKWQFGVTITQNQWLEATTIKPPLVDLTDGGANPPNGGISLPFLQCSNGSDCLFLGYLHRSSDCRRVPSVGLPVL